MKTTYCEKCQKNISNNNFKKHYQSCDSNKFYLKLDNNLKISENLYQCLYCDKTYTKMGISTHILRSHTHSYLFDNSYKFETAWNKGITKEVDSRVEKYGNTYHQRIENGELQPSFKNKKHTTETKKRIGEKLSKNNNGGRCKWFDFFKENGEKMKLQGTWEVRFAKILNLIDENWIKIGIGYKNHSFKWIDENNIEHFYTPDFYSPKLNKYFEVKGYWWGDDKLKMEKVILQNKQIKIEIIMKNELLNYEKLLMG